MVLSGEGPYRVRSVKIRSLQDFAVSWVVGKKVFSGLRFVDPHGRNTYLIPFISLLCCLFQVLITLRKQKEDKKKMARKRNTYLLSISQVLNSVFHESMNSSKTWVTLH